MCSLPGLFKWSQDLYLLYSRDHHVIERARELELQLTRLEGYKKDDHIPKGYWPSYFSDLPIFLEMAPYYRFNLFFAFDFGFDFGFEEKRCTGVNCKELDFNPDSLVRLCLVEVSMCVGFKADRNERISQTGLYPSLQRRLMFSS